MADRGLSSRVSDMGLRPFTTTDIPKGDSKRLLLGEMYRQNKEDSIQPDFLSGRELDQRVGVSDAYLILDSSERDLNTSNLSKGLITYIVRQEGITGGGYIGVKHDLSDVIEIEANSFIFPLLPCRIYSLNNESSTSKWGVNSNLPILKSNVCTEECNEPTTLPITDNYIQTKKDPCEINDDPCSLCPDYLSQLKKTRITVEIKEVSEQSVSDVGGRHHSLEYDLINYNRRDAQLTNIYASPVNFGYMFTDPITRFDTLTLQFRNQLGVEITFDPDILTSSVINCINFRYSKILPPPIVTTPLGPGGPVINAAAIPVPYTANTLLPSVNQDEIDKQTAITALSANGREALPAIPVYYEQYLEVVTPSFDGFGNIGALYPNYQLLFKKFKVDGMDSKLYRYLTNNLMLVGAKGYDPAISFRLNPDVVMTEFITAYSKRYNILSLYGGYLTIGRTSKTLSLNYDTNILLREWKAVTQPFPLPQLPLDPNDSTFFKFIEGRSFLIGPSTSSGLTQAIYIHRIDQFIKWQNTDGDKFYHVKDLKDIYYDRVVLTEVDPLKVNIATITPDATFINPDKNGVYEKLRQVVVAVPMEKPKRVRLKPGQYVAEPNIRTDIFDIVEGRNFVFDGQYVNNKYDPKTTVGNTIPNYLPTILMNMPVLINNKLQAMRILHQGIDMTTGQNSSILINNTNPITDAQFQALTPAMSNGIYHIESVDDIYADKIVLTPGLPGTFNFTTVISNNRMRIPLRFRKLVRRMTNLLAP